MSKIEVKWQASDGYVGGQRPQYTTVEISDFVGLDRDEAQKLFEEIVDDDFRQKVCVDYADYDGSLQEIMEEAKKLEAEDQ